MGKPKTESINLLREEDWVHAKPLFSGGVFLEVELLFTGRMVKTHRGMVCEVLESDGNVVCIETRAMRFHEIRITFNSFFHLFFRWESLSA